MTKSFEQIMQVTRNVSSITALSDAEAKALYDCCQQVPANGIVVETGLQLGRSSSLILQVAQDIGYHSIHIDPYTCQEELLKQWVEMMHKVGGVQDHEFTLLCMRTAQAGWLLQRLAPIDMCFIDGDHELQGVRTDITLVASLLKKGGLLAAHDYAHPYLQGVKQGMDESMDIGFWDLLGVFETMGVWRRK